MSLLGEERQHLQSPSSVQEDHLIREILLTHDPDGAQLDSMLVLQDVEKIICYTTLFSENVLDPKIFTGDISNAEAFGIQETTGGTIFYIAHQILDRCSEVGDVHAKTMCLFEMLANFDWDAKVVLVLAALSMKYGQFQLISHLRSNNHLAASVAVLIQLPCDLSMFKRQFKAFSLMMMTMRELTKLIFEFENITLQYELLESKEISIPKSMIYMACYWTFRSSLACFSLITALRTRKNGQVDTSSTSVWTYYSSIHRISSLCSKLRQQVAACNEQIDARLYERLVNRFSLSDLDNQEKLRMLIPSKDSLPLKDGLAEEKHSISELKDKVVVILVSNTELLPMERIFYLVKQTYDHPYHEKIKENYVILWFPVFSSQAWSQSDEISFRLLSNTLPFWSIRHPRLINSAVAKFIRQEWNYKEEAIMVVLDTQGKVSKPNAMDMIWTWGAKAFPFSRAREKELWEMEHWNLQFIVDDIDLLLTPWLGESKNLCIYASDNLDWITNFTGKMRKLKETGLQLEWIYVGWKNPSERLRGIVDIIEAERLSTCLSFTKICLFWLRLESLKNSILNVENAAGCDGILKEILGLLEADSSDDGWMLIGTGHSPKLLKLRGRKLTECFDLFPVWAENVGDMGLVGAITSAFEPPSAPIHCQQSDLLPYKEDLFRDTVICHVCNRPMEKLLVYKCEET